MKPAEPATPETDPFAEATRREVVKAADDYDDIRERMRQIAKDEGRG